MGCTEQTCPAFLPDVIVAQAVDKLHLRPPVDRATLNTMVATAYRLLASSTRWRLGWWPDDQSRVFMTAYVVSGLARPRKPVTPWTTPGSTAAAHGLNPRQSASDMIADLRATRSMRGQPAPLQRCFTNLEQPR